MIRIDISCDLKDKSGKFRFIGFHLTFFCLGRTGARSNFHKCIQQFLYTEVIQCRPEKYRSHLAFQVLLHIEFRINTVNQFQFSAQFFSQRSTDLVV